MKRDVQFSPAVIVFLLCSILIVPPLLTGLEFPGEDKTIPSPPTTRATTTISTTDGLSLTVDQTSGLVQGVSVGAAGLGSTTPSAFSLHDRIPDTKVSDVGGPLVSAGGSHSQTETVTSVETIISATYTEHSNHIEIRGTIDDTRSSDRAITVGYSLPVRFIPGWKFHYDMQRSDTIIEPNVYSADTSRYWVSGSGWRDYNSRYTLCAISDDNAGLAFGLPLDEYYRYWFDYDSNNELFSIYFDLGITNRATDHFDGNGSFSFIIFKLDEPEWGFRSALDKYYDIYPWAFEKRETNEGLVVAFDDLRNADEDQNGDGPIEDFGIAFWSGVDSGDGLEGQWLNNKGIEIYSHCQEPGFKSISIGSTTPTYAEVENQLDNYYNAGGDARDQANAVFTSALFKDQAVDPRDYKMAGTKAKFYQNTDPDVPYYTDGPANHNHNQKDHKFKKIDYFYDHSSTAANSYQVDGMLMDSLEGSYYRQNYRDSHIQVTKNPPTFDVDSKNVTLVQPMGMLEFLKDYQTYVHSKGDLSMANAAVWQVPHYEAYLDVSITEVTWADANGFALPADAHEDMAFKRSTCYQKQHCFLYDPDDFTWIDYEDTEKYMQFCLFYGIFPGMGNDFNSMGENHSYFTDPYGTPGNEWYMYNRDRDLFKKYVPLVQDISKAGWEPVTYGKTDDPEFLIERYGYKESDDLHFTVFNKGGAGTSTTITLDASDMGIKGNVHVRDLVSNTTLPSNYFNGKITFPLTLLADDTAVLSIIVSDLNISINGFDPLIPRAEDQVDIHYSIANTNDHFESFKVGFYIDNISTSGQTLDLNPGEIEQRTFIYSSATPGWHWFGVMIDMDEQIGETNESNNYDELLVYVLPHPDLTLSVKNTSIGPFFEGGQIIFEVDVEVNDTVPFQYDPRLEMFVDNISVAFTNVQVYNITNKKDRDIGEGIRGQGEERRE